MKGSRGGCVRRACPRRQTEGLLDQEDVVVVLVDEKPFPLLPVKMIELHQNLEKKMEMFRPGYSDSLL